jgi:hypothetical protein
MAFGGAEERSGSTYLPVRGLCAGAGSQPQQTRSLAGAPCMPQRLPRQLNANPLQSAWGLADLCGPGFGVTSRCAGDWRFRGPARSEIAVFMDFNTSDFPKRPCEFSAAQVISRHGNTSRPALAWWLSEDRARAAERNPLCPADDALRLSMKMSEAATCHGFPTRLCIG